MLFRARRANLITVTARRQRALPPLDKQNYVLVLSRRSPGDACARRGAQTKNPWRQIPLALPSPCWWPRLSPSLAVVSQNPRARTRLTLSPWPGQIPALSGRFSPPSLPAGTTRGKTPHSVHRAYCGLREGKPMPRLGAAAMVVGCRCASRATVRRAGSRAMRQN